MPNPWVTKLQHFAALSDDDKALLDHLISRQRRFAPGEDLVAEKEVPRQVHVVLEGCCVRYKLLPDGRRQNIALMLPGDLCDMHVFLLKEMDHSIGALVPTTVALIEREQIVDISEKHPRLTRAMWWSTLQDEAILREWLLNVGRRTAFERLAHLFYEIYVRLHAVGLAGENRCEIPLTQGQLADTLGISNVHVNRSVQRLRREKLIELHGRTLTITDPDGLKALSAFDPSYLHLDGGTNGPPGG